MAGSSCQEYVEVGKRVIFTEYKFVEDGGFFLPTGVYEYVEVGKRVIFTNLSTPAAFGDKVGNQIPRIQAVARKLDLGNIVP